MGYYTNKQLAKVIDQHGIDETDAARGRPKRKTYNPSSSVRPKMRTKDMERKQAAKTKSEFYTAKDAMVAAEDKKYRNSLIKGKKKKSASTVKKGTQPIQMKTVNRVKRGR